MRSKASLKTPRQSVPSVIQTKFLSFFKLIKLKLLSVIHRVKLNFSALKKKFHLKNLRKEKERENQQKRSFTEFKTGITPRFSKRSNAQQNIEPAQMSRSTRQSKLALSTSKPKQTSNIFHNPKFKLFGISFLIAAFLVLTIGGYTYYWMINKRSYFIAVIKYEPQIIKDSKTLSLNPTDPNTSDMPTSTLKAEDSTTGFAVSTGEKEKGDKAKGKITIFNSTTEVQELAKGTKVTCIKNACQNLTYVLDNKLNLGPFDDQQVSVTAGDRGDQYNIDTGLGRFKVGEFDPTSEMVSTNINPIKGGTPKKTVKVVTENDIKKAEQEAIESLKKRLLRKIKEDPENSNFLLSESTYQFDLLSSKPDNEEKTEAETVNVTIKGKASVKAFETDRLAQITEEFKETKNIDGYIMQDQTLPNPWKIVTEAPNNLEIEINIQLKAVPDINPVELKTKLAGTRYNSIDEKLNKISNIEGYEKSITPDSSLPLFLRKVPNNLNKVEIRLVEKEVSNSG